MAGPPAALGRLVSAGMLDPELGALLWLLAEHRVPFLLAGPPGACDLLVDALTEALPADLDRRALDGDDASLGWMAEAVSLGWVDPSSSSAVRSSAAKAESADARRTVILAGRFESHEDDPEWGHRARTVIRSLQAGYGMIATLDASSLEEVLARLSAPDVGASDDELRRLGVVVIVGSRDDADPQAGAGRAADDPSSLRVLAVHYLRPLERDAAGHLQRRPPAVLATWDRDRDVFEHFAWGVTPDLAIQTGMTQAAFEESQMERIARLREPNAQQRDRRARIDPSAARRGRAERARGGGPRIAPTPDRRSRLH